MNIRSAPFVALVAAAMLIAGGSAMPRVASPAFFPDDPVQRVPESQDASGVKEFEHSLAYDIIVNTFARPGDPSLDTPAANVNTIDEPALAANGDLTFVNAAVAGGVAQEPRGGYRAAWFRFDNATGESAPLGESNAGETTVKAPRPLPIDVDTYVRIDVTAIDPPHSSWTVPVRIYFRRLPDAWKLVGLQRGEAPQKLHTRGKAFTSTGS